MTDFQHRILDLRKKLGLTQALFAEKLGVNRTTLIGYEKGTFPPSADCLRSACLNCNVNAEWLLTGEGDMFLADSDHVQQDSAVSIKENHHSSTDTAKVPLLRQKVSCGPGKNWEDGDNIEKYIDAYTLLPHIRPERMFALLVEGTSMIGAGIQNGDYVLFDADTNKIGIPPDGIYVFALDGDVYCKRLEFDRLAGKMKIYSVRVAEIEKAELVKELDLSDPGLSSRLVIFGHVVSWVHPNHEA